MNNTILIDVIEDLDRIDEKVESFGITEEGKNISFACNFNKVKNMLDIFDRSASLVAAIADSSYMGFETQIYLNDKTVEEIVSEIKQKCGINVVFAYNCGIETISEKLNVLNIKELNELYQLLTK